MTKEFIPLRETLVSIRKLDPEARTTLMVRLWCMVAFLLVSLYVLTFSLNVAPRISGDGTEYVTMTESWIHHFSPEARPSDFASTASALPFQKGLNVAKGYYRAPNGVFYSYHFSFYSLLCVPAALFFLVNHGTIVGAFLATDTILLSLAVASILFLSALATRQKIVFTTLLLVSPVWWYLHGTAVEISSLSFVVLALSALSCKRYPLAAFLAALASLQNPPLLVLVLYIVALSTSTKHRKTIAQTLAASLISLLPFAFYEHYFGVPSLIKALGMASFDFVSWQRIASAFFDLNQGFLPYVPGIVLMTFYSVASACYHRKWDIVLLFACVLGVLALCATTFNWNSGAFGLMRYLLWTYPLLIWIVVQSFQFHSRGSQLALAATLLCQLCVVRIGYGDYLHFTPLSKWVQAKYPNYPLEAEIWKERTAHEDSFDTKDASRFQKAPTVLTKVGT